MLELVLADDIRSALTCFWLGVRGLLVPARWVREFSAGA